MEGGETAIEGAVASSRPDSTAPLDAAAAVVDATDPSPDAINNATPRDLTNPVTPAAHATATPGQQNAPSTPMQPEQVDAPVPSQSKGGFDFLRRKDQYIKPDPSLPEDAEFALAKAFLQSTSDKSEMNVYDHLSLTIMRILETRPNNAADLFENISAEVKRSKFNVEVPGAPGSLRKAPEDPVWDTVAKEHVKLFEKPASDEDDKVDDSNIGEIPDIMDLSNLWEWAGVSFGKEETFMLFLSLKRLVSEKPLKSVRLWGKILGLNNPFIIVEGEVREGAQDDDDAIANPSPVDVDIENKDAAENSGEKPGGVENELSFGDETGLPKPKVKVVPPLPKEVRAGANKYVYYTCTYIGGPWVRLPDVIPEKLQASRKIYKYFTGDLSRQVISYPAFDGNEAQLLRCTIARISAATVASPAGYYMFDPEEAEGEDAEHNSTIIINPEYEGLSNDALLSLSNWVHHVPYILPQGRVTWENPVVAGSGNNGEDGGGGDEDGGSDGGSDVDDSNNGSGSEPVEPEAGPPILTSLSADDEYAEGIPAWTSRSCSSLSPSKFSPVCLKSTRWPGAMVVAYNDKFANIYVGDGQRMLPTSNDGLFIPPPLPEVCKEFVLLVKPEDEDAEDGAMKETELVEQKDPTVEEEKAFEEAKKAKEEEGKEEEEEAENEEGDGEDEDN